MQGASKKRYARWASNMSQLMKVNDLIKSFRDENEVFGVKFEEDLTIDIEKIFEKLTPRLANNLR